MKLAKQNSGYSLIELMVTVGILGVLAGIAIPAYNNYISTGTGAVGMNNVATLRSFQENYMLENETYLLGTHPAGAASSVLTTGLHWKPDDNGKYTYAVTPGLSGDIRTSLRITATCDACPNPIIEEN